MLTVEQQMEMNRVSQLNGFNNKLLDAVNQLTAKVDAQTATIAKLEKEVKALSKKKVTEEV